MARKCSFIRADVTQCLAEGDECNEKTCVTSDQPNGSYRRRKRFKGPCVSCQTGPFEGGQNVKSDDSKGELRSFIFWAKTLDVTFFLKHCLKAPLPGIIYITWETRSPCVSCRNLNQVRDKGLQGSKPKLEKGKKSQKQPGMDLNKWSPWHCHQTEQDIYLSIAIWPRQCTWLISSLSSVMGIDRN